MLVEEVERALDAVVCETSYKIRVIGETLIDLEFPLGLQPGVGVELVAVGGFDDNRVGLNLRKKWPFESADDRVVMLDVFLGKGDAQDAGQEAQVVVGIVEISKEVFRRGAN